MGKKILGGLKMKRRKEISSVLAAAMLFTGSVSFADSFEDIKNHWSEKYVNSLSSEEIVQGSDSGDFRPEDEITREEVSAILERVFDKRNVYVEYEAEPLELTDIEGRWSTESIKYLMSKGVIKGYPDKTFRPEGKITRQELAAMIQRIINPEAEGDGDVSFSDIGEEWGKDAIELLSKLNIITGYPDGSFRPNDYVKRSEAAKMIYEVMAEETYLLNADDIEKEEPKDKEIENVEDDKKPSSGGAYTRKADFTNLNEAIEKAKILNSEEEIEELKNALAEAEEIARNPKSKQSEVDEMTDRLEELISENNEAPVITIPEKVYVYYGEKLDLLNGVTANDKEDGDITDKIEVIHNIPLYKTKPEITKITYPETPDNPDEGVIYPPYIVKEGPTIGEKEGVSVTYKVTDSLGKTTEKKVSPYFEIKKATFDFNEDGILNVADYYCFMNIVYGAEGEDPANYEPYDLDENGILNSYDIDLVKDILNALGIGTDPIM